MKRLGLFLLVMILPGSDPLLAEELPQAAESPSIKTESSAAVPNVSEVILLVAELSGRLAVFENKERREL